MMYYSAFQNDDIIDAKLERKDESQETHWLRGLKPKMANSGPRLQGFVCDVINKVDRTWHFRVEEESMKDSISKDKV